MTMEVSAILTPNADEAAIPDDSRLTNQSMSSDVTRVLTIAPSDLLYLDHSTLGQARHRASASQLKETAHLAHDLSSTKIDAAETVGEAASLAFGFLDVVDMLYVRDVCADIPSIVMTRNSNSQKSLTRVF